MLTVTRGPCARGINIHTFCRILGSELSLHVLKLNTHHKCILYSSIQKISTPRTNSMHEKRYRLKTTWWSLYMQTNYQLLVLGLTIYDTICCTSSTCYEHSSTWLWSLYDLHGLRMFHVLRCPNNTIMFGNTFEYLKIYLIWLLLTCNIAGFLALIEVCVPFSTRSLENDSITSVQLWWISHPIRTL